MIKGLGSRVILGSDGKELGMKKLDKQEGIKSPRIFIIVYIEKVKKEKTTIFKIGYFKTFLKYLSKYFPMLKKLDKKIINPVNRNVIIIR